MYHLGEKYLPQNIAITVENNPYYYQNRYLEFTKPRKKNKYKVHRLKGNFKNIKKLSGIDMLFLSLYYFMGLLPKEKPRYTPLSPEMKQEVRKLERYSNEIRLIVSEKLKTVDDVKSYISQTEKEIEDITNLRQKYRNKLRNCIDDNLIKEYKSKRDNCTTILNRHRKNIKIANYILEDTPNVKKVIEIEKQMRKEQEDIAKTKKKDRYEKWY